MEGTAPPPKSPADKPPNVVGAPRRSADAFGVPNLRLACRSLGLSLRAGRSDGGHSSSSASAPCCSSTISSLIG